nr:E267 [uncultured bacterium]
MSKPCRGLIMAFRGPRAGSQVWHRDCCFHARTRCPAGWGVPATARCARQEIAHGHPPGNCGGHRTHPPPQPADPASLPCPHDACATCRPGAQGPALRQSGACLRGVRHVRQGGTDDWRGRQHRHRVRLQRHAVGPPAAGGLPRHPQAGGGGTGRRGAVCRRRAGHVRRRHAGRGGHGPVAVLARHDCTGHRRGAVAQRVRWGAVPGRVRQDRAGAADRRPGLWPPAGDLRARRADAVGSVQCRKGQDPPAVCRGQDRPRRPAGGRIARLPRAGHLHLLRYRQHQPDADGADGPAPAGHRLRESGHAAARRADGAGRPARGATGPRRTPGAAVRGGGRALCGQRHGRPAGYRRFHQSRPACAGHRRRGRHRRRLGRSDRAVVRGAAAGAGVSEWQCRREPVPRRRWHGLRGAGAARWRAAAPRGLHRGRLGPCRLRARAVSGPAGRSGLARGA